MKTDPKCRRPLGVHGRFGWLLAVAAAWVPFAGCSNGPSYPTRDAAVELPVETGSVNVTGGFDQCPTLLIQISPTLVRVGQTITVDGQAASADGGALTFAWTSTSGTFQEPAAASTTFTCVTAGPATITLSVSDGICVTSQSAPATCVAIADGGVSGGGMSGSTGTGGAGGGGGGVPPNMCPAHEPLSGDLTACEACTAANCGLDPDPDGDAGCCALPELADQLLCEAVVNCFQTPPGGAPPCTTNGDGTNCFCGASSGAGTCFTTAGAANGPCASQVAAAAKSSKPTMIQALFSDPNSPLGRANNLLNCRGSFCKAACAIH